MIRILERDRALFAHLSKYQILSTAQIRQLVFSESDYPTTLRRLRLLKKANLLHSIGGLKFGSHAWFLTKKGARLIGTGTPWRFRNRNTLEHDLTVVDLRLALEKAGLGNTWVTEQELKRKAFDPLSRDGSSKVIPDALLIEKSGPTPKSIALELELTVKSKARYANSLGTYARKKNIDVLWYVVRSDREGNRIAAQYQTIKKHPTSPRLELSLLDEVLSNPHICRGLLNSRRESAAA